MPTKPPASDIDVDIRFTPEFKRNLRALSKRFRHLRSDIEPVIEQLLAGHFIGDQIPRTGYTLYKVRIGNRDAQRGKSGGYRLIYYLRTPQSVILITIYSKSEQSDISTAEVRRIIREFEESKT
jgi:mRNA-degrading endonuclease RelE of RelBE toxin-antitoxin system